jgi:SNF2 family DNA or RNA helicase
LNKKRYLFLEQSHPKFHGKNNYFLTFEEASHKNWFYNFFHSQLKDNFEVTGMDMLSYFRYSDHQITSHFELINTIDNEINAKLDVSFGNEKINLKTLQKNLLEGQKFILLKDNSLGILNDEWVDQFGMLLRYSKILDDEISFAKWILISSESFRNFSKELQFIIPENWTQKWKNWKDSDSTLIQLPNELKAEMRNYQQKGFEWMNLMAEVNAGTLLADDMGLGKTLQTIASITSWQEQNFAFKGLVVCPASLLYNWKNEFEKFAPHISTFIYHGNNRNFGEFILSEHSVLITSYSIVRNEIENFTKLVWDAIVLDESHHIKNYSALQTQAVLQLMGKRRIALNGTPIMNNVTDLFPQLNFILPQLFSSFSKFKSDFEKPIQHELASLQMEMLKKLTSPFILRRTKEIVAPDLPPKTESILWCEMQDDQRFAYESLKEQIKENVFVEIKNQGVNKAKLGVLQGITKLRQVCSSPQLIKEEDDFKFSSSVKINQLIELLNTNLKNEKVLVFSQFIGTMDLLATEFKKHKISFVSFDGSTAAEKRMQLVTEFQREDSTIQVFLVSLMAGNSGINLTRANYVFLVEPWWNKAVQQQAIDRTHRIGQNQHVFAYNMICKDTIEEKIITLQNRKQFISDEVISSDDNFVKNLTEEDIVYLFE